MSHATLVRIILKYCLYGLGWQGPSTPPPLPPSKKLYRTNFIARLYDKIEKDVTRGNPLFGPIAQA